MISSSMKSSGKYVLYQIPQVQIVNLFADVSLCAYVRVSKILRFKYLSNKKSYEDSKDL